MQTPLPERWGECSLSGRPAVSADDCWRFPLSGTGCFISGDTDR